METEVSVPEVKKASKFNVLLVFIVILFLAAIGLGVWGYLLTNDIKTAQADRSALQTRYDGLTKEKNTLSSNLDKAKTDLEKTKKDLDTAKEDLSSAQSDLSKSKSQVTELQGKIDKVVAYLDVAVEFFVNSGSLTNVGNKVEAVHDTTLTEKFNAYSESKNSVDFNAWLTYLFVTISDLLKAN